MNDAHRVSSDVSGLKRITESEAVIGDGGVAKLVSVFAFGLQSQSQVAVIVLTTNQREVVSVKVFQPLEEDWVDVVVEAASVVGVTALLEDVVGDGNALGFERDQRMTSDRGMNGNKPLHLLGSHHREESEDEVWQHASAMGLGEQRGDLVIGVDGDVLGLGLR